MSRHSSRWLGTVRLPFGCIHIAQAVARNVSVISGPCEGFLSHTFVFWVHVDLANVCDYSVGGGEAHF